MSLDIPNVTTIKLILIGNSGVGKSSLSCHFTENRFVEQDATIGVEFGTRTITIGDSKYKIQVWDTAGQETFRAITKSYYRIAMGVLLVYDVTNYSSFESIPGWYRSIQENSSENIPIILVGNKNDQLDTNRKVKFSDGQELAKQYGVLFCETSAKSLDLTKSAFNRLVEKIIREKINVVHKDKSEMTNDYIVNLRRILDYQKPKKSYVNKWC